MKPILKQQAQQATQTKLFPQLVQFVHDLQSKEITEKEIQTVITEMGRLAILRSRTAVILKTDNPEESFDGFDFYGIPVWKTVKNPLHFFIDDAERICNTLRTTYGNNYAEIVIG